MRLLNDQQGSKDTVSDPGVPQLLWGSFPSSALQGEEASRRGTLERPRHGRRGQEKGMWLWVSRQAGFSGEAPDWSLGVAAPDYLK